MKYLLLIPFAIGLAIARDADPGEPPVKSPFLKKEDSLCTNDWWKRPANPIIDLVLFAGSPLPWTGDSLDGFHNKIRMVAHANPDTKRKKNAAPEKDGKTTPAPDNGWADGYGLIRFRKSAGEVTFECWPRSADVTKPDARQLPGWPVVAKP